jgi:hypothetical protein
VKCSTLSTPADCRLQTTQAKQAYLSGSDLAKSQFASCCCATSASEAMLSAPAGQARLHRWQPVQSSGDTYRTVRQQPELLNQNTRRDVVHAVLRYV